MLLSLFTCVNECYIMYLYDFAYECVRIRIRNCAIIGVFAFIVVITIYLPRLIEIRFPDPMIRLRSDSQEESQHRQRQRPPQNSQDANTNNDELFQSKDQAKASKDNDNYDHALDAQ